MSCDVVAQSRAVPTLPPVSIFKPAQQPTDSISPDSDYLTRSKDSGYSSLDNSPDGLEKGEQSRHKRPRGGPLPFNLRRTEDLKAFGLDIEPTVAARFEDIFPTIEHLLLACLRTSGKRFYPVSIRLAVLGVTVADARPRIAVFCHSSYDKLMRRFFNRDDIKELCKPNDDSLYAFEVRIINKPPLKHAAKSPLTLDFANLEEGAGKDGKRLSSCGTAIRYRRSDGTTAFATLGGIVKLVGGDSDFSLFGMTVAHIFESSDEEDDFWPGEDDESVDESDEYMSNEDEEPQTPSRAASSLEPPLLLDEVNEKLIPAAELTDINATEASWMEDNVWKSLEVDVVAESGHGKDWALVKVAESDRPTILLPNRIPRDASSSVPSVYLKEQTLESVHIGSRSIVISSACGAKYGDFSVGVGKTMFSMNGFTNSYLITSGSRKCLFWF
jgi:hypothetical protein